MSVSFSLIRLKAVSVTLLILLLFLGNKGQATPDTKVLLSNGTHCTDINVLAAATGAELSFGDNGKNAGLTRGNYWVAFSAGDIIYATSGNIGVLPTVPLRLDGIYYAPTRAVVESLGGSLEVYANGIEINCGGRSTLVPLAVADSPPRNGIDRFMYDLHDPRVPVEEYQEIIQIVNDIREKFDEFDSAAGTASLLLEGMIQTGQLGELFGQNPNGEDFGPLAEAVIIAIADALGAFEILVENDEAKAAPIRRGLQGAYEIQLDPTASRISQVRGDWIGSQSAISLQLAENADARQKTLIVLSTMSVLVRFLGNTGDEFSDMMADATLESIDTVSDMVLTYLDAHRWHLETFDDYFEQLVEDTVYVPAGWEGEGDSEEPDDETEEDISFNNFRVFSANVGTSNPLDLDKIFKLPRNSPEEAAVTLTLKDLKPDIAVLLEVSDIDQVDLLLSETGKEYFIEGGPFDFICINKAIVKGDFLDDKLFLEGHGGWLIDYIGIKFTGFVKFRLKGTNQSVQVFYTHPPADNAQARINNFEWISDHVIRSIPSLVMGDFNVDFVRNRENPDVGQISDIIYYSQLGSFNPWISKNTPELGYAYTNVALKRWTIDWVLGSRGTFIDPSFDETFRLESSYHGIVNTFDHYGLYGIVKFDDPAHSPPVPPLPYQPSGGGSSAG